MCAHLGQLAAAVELHVCTDDLGDISGDEPLRVDIVGGLHGRQLAGRQLLGVDRVSRRQQPLVSVLIPCHHAVLASLGGLLQCNRSATLCTGSYEQLKWDPSPSVQVAASAFIHSEVSTPLKSV